MAGDDAEIDRWTEPGRHVNEFGQIVTHWPPEGRFVGLWDRLHEVFSDDEKHDILALLTIWRDENSSLVAYTDESGQWVDVEPDWSVIESW